MHYGNLYSDAYQSASSIYTCPKAILESSFQSVILATYRVRAKSSGLSSKPVNKEEVCRALKQGLPSVMFPEDSHFPVRRVHNLEQTSIVFKGNRCPPPHILKSDILSSAVAYI